MASSTNPRFGTPSAGLYRSLNQISDPAIRTALKSIMDEQAEIQRLIQQIGGVSKPLSQALDASGYRLRRLQDALDPQDAVTLRQMQDYVANFASAFPGGLAEAGGGEGQGESSTAPPDDIADHFGDVTALWNSAPLGPASPEVDLYRFVQALANILLTADPPHTCGLQYKPAGANIYNCMGTSYGISRICYDNGACFKVLIDADPGGIRTPTWAWNGYLDVSDYRSVAASGAC